MPGDNNIEAFQSLSLIDLGIQYVQEPTNKVLKYLLLKKLREFGNKHFF